MAAEQIRVCSFQRCTGRKKPPTYNKVSASSNEARVACTTPTTRDAADLSYMVKWRPADIDAWS